MTQLNMRLALGLCLAAAFAGQSFANKAMAQTAPASSATKPISPRQGWVITSTPHSFPVLVQRLEAAIQTQKMGMVNFASASDGAKAQGITIPGNRVVGVFRNDYARRMLVASLASGIEAPVRFYLTENADGTATLSYRPPGTIFAPYVAEASPDLKILADELDAIFSKIAAEASAR